MHVGGDGAAWPTRIFTPGAELPFAGHPTVGTAVLLAELGLAPDRVVLAEPVGDIDVAIEARPGGWAATLRTAVAPTFAEAPDRDVLARALGVESADLHRDLAAGVWSCGVPFCVVPLRDTAALARAHLEPTVWAEHLEHTDAAQLFPIAPLDDGLHRWRARMFAPGLGIAEDPATGAAAAAAAGLLAASRQLRARARCGGSSSRAWRWAAPASCASPSTTRGRRCRPCWWAATRSSSATAPSRSRPSSSCVPLARSSPLRARSPSCPLRSPQPSTSCPRQPSLAYDATSADDRHLRRLLGAGEAGDRGTGVRLNDPILREAGALLPPEIRSLEAIHLATVVHLRQDVGTLITYDARMAAAARALKLRTASPA